MKRSPEGGKAHTNTQKLILYILTITDVFLNKKRVNLRVNYTSVPSFPHGLFLNLLHSTAVYRHESGMCHSFLPILIQFLSYNDKQDFLDAEMSHLSLHVIISTCVCYSGELFTVYLLIDRSLPSLFCLFVVSNFIVFLSHILHVILTLLNLHNRHITPLVQLLQVSHQL